ncbi:PREDICTED: coiled-coil and C2 domain-containing protein 2A-like [Elephantulus edwardii]|uniref:coiled-coil and C2 domain-containing protein 2A-like n=1 Tax=Elephantulus edwardii TaxID=28737 RepID=UPI0003F05FFE|nr:PREDICTED: coiled-coil and C2 domain-containing protein 2A-like [Elephantulus edwardii]
MHSRPGRERLRSRAELHCACSRACVPCSQRARRRVAKTRELQEVLVTFPESTMPEEKDIVEDIVDKHLKKDLATEEKQDLMGTLRGKVREKLKNAKTSVSLDEGLSFFILNGEENSHGQTSDQRPVNYYYQRHGSLDESLPNVAEGQDESFMEEVVYPDLMEVKAAEYDEDQEQTKNQANLFVPSSSPGIIIMFSDKAVKSDLESSIRKKVENRRDVYELDLNIVGLQFSHHPLFNREQVLCARLLQLYECFQNRQQHNLPQLLYEKLKALTDATKLANEQSEINQLTEKSLQDYYWQIRIKTNKYDEQNQELSEISESENKTEGNGYKNGEKRELCNIHVAYKFTVYFLSVSVLRNLDARTVPVNPWRINTEKLFEWATEVRIDPNNPEYSDLVEFIMSMKRKDKGIPEYFRLEQLQDEFNFISEEEMKRSKRFQLLQLRNAGQLDAFLLQQIPLYDQEIPDLVFQMRRLIKKKLVKVNRFNLSDIVADYEEIISARYILELF